VISLSQASLSSQPSLTTIATMQEIVRLARFALLAASLFVSSPRIASAQYSFDDEFNGTSLDTTVWVPLNRPGDSSGSEQQYYLPSNETVSGGNLAITCKLDFSQPGYGYTSEMIQWRSFNFTYGTVEIRAKMAGGKGTWSTLWLLGSNCQQTNVHSADNVPPCNWPQPGSDEIDIAEVYRDLTTVHESVRSGSSFYTYPASTTDVSQNWHVYKLIWAPGSLTWIIDGVTTYTVTSGVPSNPMFLLIDIALGGAGGAIDNSTLPQTMLIDYVRVTPYDLTPPNESLFPTQIPASVHNTDGISADHELGTRFQSSAPGRITAIRFWKDSGETGPHTGRIWNATGALLASVAFTDETASGWQQQNLAPPLPITANTEYMTSVNTVKTYYVATDNGLGTRVANGHLSSIVGGNGRFGPRGSYPTQTYHSLNYFRDVVFVADGYNLFPSELPAGQYNDGVRYELGTQFHSSYAGHITALRFYKPWSGSGDYVMHVWNGSGDLVATQDLGTYGTNTYGWITVNVGPIPLDANYDTTVAVELPSDSWYYACSPDTLPIVSHPPLAAVQGRYGRAGSYPTNITSNNYFVDVVYNVP
jgi:beta-glucanase (GH16 family)